MLFNPGELLVLGSGLKTAAFREGLVDSTSPSDTAARIEAQH